MSTLLNVNINVIDVSSNTTQSINIQPITQQVGITSFDEVKQRESVPLSPKEQYFVGDNNEEFSLKIFTGSNQKLLDDLTNFREIVTEIEIHESLNENDLGSTRAIFRAMYNLPNLKKINTLFLAKTLDESAIYLNFLFEVLKKETVVYLRFVLTPRESVWLDQQLVKQKLLKNLVDTKIKVVVFNEIEFLSSPLESKSITLLNSLLTAIYVNKNIEHFVWDISYLRATDNIRLPECTETNTYFTLLSVILFTKKTFRYGCRKNIDILTNIYEILDDNRSFDLMLHVPLQSFQIDLNYQYDINHVIILDKFLRACRNIVDFSIYGVFRNNFFHDIHIHSFLHTIQNRYFKSFVIGQLPVNRTWIKFVIELIKKNAIRDIMRIVFRTNYKIPNQQQLQIFADLVCIKLLKHFLIEKILETHLQLPRYAKINIIEFLRPFPTELIIDFKPEPNIESTQRIMKIKPSSQITIKTCESLKDYAKTCSFTLISNDNRII